jgi:shikimate kinase
MARKILLASGNKNFDEYFRLHNGDRYEIYHISQYSAETLLNRIIEEKIDILLIGEMIPTVRTLQEELRDILTEAPQLIVVIYSKKNKERGDEFFNDMLNIGVNRFIYGAPIQMKDVISAIEDEITPGVYLKWRPEKFRIISEDGEKSYDFSKIPSSPEEITSLFLNTKDEVELEKLFLHLAKVLNKEELKNTFEELPKNTKKSLFNVFLKKEKEQHIQENINLQHNKDIIAEKEIYPVPEEEIVIGEKGYEDDSLKNFSQDVLLEFISKMTDKEKEDLGLISREEIEVIQRIEVVREVEVVKEIPVNTEKVNILLLSPCPTGKTTLGMSIAECMGKFYNKKAALLSLDSKKDLEVIFNIESEGELATLIDNVKKDNFIDTDEILRSAYNTKYYDVYCGKTEPILSETADRVIKYLNTLYDVVIVDGGRDEHIQNELSKTVTTKKIMVINQDICVLDFIENHFTIPIYNTQGNECSLLINEFRKIKQFEDVLAESKMLSKFNNILYVQYNEGVLEQRLKSSGPYRKGSGVFDKDIEDICALYIGEIKKRKNVFDIFKKNK